MRIEEFNYTQDMDITPAILWQYENAPNLMKLIQNKQTWLDINHSAFWLDFQQNIFDLTTATPTIFGLSVWSIILNLPLYVQINPDDTDKPTWGFNEASPTPPPDFINSYKNFGDTIALNPGSGNFSTQGSYFTLTIFEQQFLLRLRYFQLSNLGDIIDINQFLNYLCTDNRIQYSGTIYVVDNLDMTISYVFTANDFPPDLLNVINDLDLLPRPAGVAIV